MACTLCSAALICINTDGRLIRGKATGCLWWGDGAGGEEEDKEQEEEDGNVGGGG